MTRIVVDTNVPVCANQKTPQASPACVLACINRLEALKRRGMVVIDDGGAIVSEYERHLSRAGQPGVGDAFYKWLVSNLANRYRVKRLAITANDAGTSYTEFPSDPDLAGFDADDHKFVAVAIVAGSRRRPPVVNATDTDWKIFEPVLRRHGVAIEFLCPELMASVGL